MVQVGLNRIALHTDAGKDVGSADERRPVLESRRRRKGGRSSSTDEELLREAFDLCGQ